MLIWSCFFVCWALTLEYLCRLIKTTGFYGRRQTIGFSLSFGGLRRWIFLKEVLNSIVWDVFPLMMLDWKGIYDALRLWMTTPYILRCKDTLAEVNLSRDSRYFHQLFWIILSPVFSISSQTKFFKYFDHQVNFNRGFEAMFQELSQQITKNLVTSEYAKVRLSYNCCHLKGVLFVGAR